MNDQELLSLCNEYIKYNPETGILTWKKTVRESGTRIAGKECGWSEKRGYRCVGLSYKSYLSHRIAFLMYHKYLPEFIDHRNEVKGDNRICNLRAATKSENTKNTRLRSDNKSGIKGVSWNKNAKKWIAYVDSIYLGTFSDIREAENVVKLKRIESHGEFHNHG